MLTTTVPVNVPDASAPVLAIVVSRMKESEATDRVETVVLHAEVHPRNGVSKVEEYTDVAMASWSGADSELPQSVSRRWQRSVHFKVPSGKRSQWGSHEIMSS
jgi:hypothetical protein